MTRKPRKKPNGNDSVVEKPAQSHASDDDPVERKHREAAARVFASIRLIRRNAGKPKYIADIVREMFKEWWELCVGTWRSEEQAHRNYDAIRSDPLTVAMWGSEWEEWPRHFTTLKECIQVQCGGLEKILLARLEREGEPKLWDDKEEEDGTVEEDDRKEKAD